MEKLEAALSALDEAASEFLSRESFGRSEAGLVTVAEQMLQMRAAWGKQIEVAKPKPAPVMPEYVTEQPKTGG